MSLRWMHTNSTTTWIKSKMETTTNTSNVWWHKSKMHACGEWNSRTFLLWKWSWQHKPLLLQAFSNHNHHFSIKYLHLYRFQITNFEIFFFLKSKCWSQTIFNKKYVSICEHKIRFLFLKMLFILLGLKNALVNLTLYAHLKCFLAPFDNTSDLLRTAYLDVIYVSGFEIDQNHSDTFACHI